MNTQYRKNLKAVLEASKTYCDERISDLEWQIGTYNYDVATDSNVARIKTLPSDTYKSQIDYIGGKSCKYNQLIQNGNFESVSGWDLFGGTLSANNNVGYFTINNVGNQAQRIQKTNVLNIVNGHKYFVKGSIKTPRNSQCYIQFFSDNANLDIATFSTTANIKYTFTQLLTASVNLTGLRLYCNRDGSLQIDDVVEYSEIETIDLTDIFGAGNEPSDVATAISLLKANGYKLDETDTYSTGELKHAITTSVVYSGTDVQDITLQIPSQVLELELNKSAGSVYDVTDFNSKVGTRKVGAYTFTGNEVWYSRTAGDFYTNITTDYLPKSETLNIINDMGLTPRTSTYSTNGIALQIDNGKMRIYVRNSAITDTASAKAFTSGKHLTYELATFDETDISEYLTTDFKVNLDKQYATCEMVVDEPIDMPNSITNLIKEVKA